MDDIVLGLLLLSSRTIYELRERIDKGLHLMYSSSMGSIQAAIRKLLENGSIRYEERVERGKRKKIYSITESGKRRFQEWVNSPMQEQRAKNPELAKLYFMGFSDPNSRAAAVEQHLAGLREQYEALRLICAEGDRALASEERKDIVFFQLAAARYGRDFVKFNIDWYENFLGEITKGKG